MDSQMSDADNEAVKWVYVDKDGNVLPQGVPYFARYAIAPLDDDDWTDE